MLGAGHLVVEAAVPLFPLRTEPSFLSLEEEEAFAAEGNTSHDTLVTLEGPQSIWDATLP
jgi:hypothetical protein